MEVLALVAKQNPQLNAITLINGSCAIKKVGSPSLQFKKKFRNQEKFSFFTKTGTNAQLKINIKIH